MEKKLEKHIQREICDWLSLKGFYFWRQNTQPVFSEGKFRAMGKYALRGLPDIMIIHKGIFIGIEVKKPGYWKFTNEQKLAQEKIQKNGGMYLLATTLDEVIEFFTYLDLN